MNTLVNNGLKALACGTAAVAITLLASLTFIQSTAVVHNSSSTPAPAHSHPRRKTGRLTRAPCRPPRAAGRLREESAAMP